MIRVSMAVGHRSWDVARSCAKLTLIIISLVMLPLNRQL